VFSNQNVIFRQLKSQLKLRLSINTQHFAFCFIGSCSGLCAEEIHVCGEAAAIDLVTELMYTTGEEVEVSFLIL